MRRPVKNRNIAGPDIKFGSARVEKFINSVMQEGKKSTARTVVYDAFDIIKEKAKVENPVELFENAIRNVSPAMEIRSRRVGGANYQVPREVRPERKQAMAFRWIIQAARNGKGRPMAEKLAAEIISANNNEGFAFKKKEDVHRMAEANKAFAHFAW
ncbi:MAG TPA: 30S ribosomal protein S7 [Candidatus Paceibacterota bacterium]|jgi:small subunit ribosomal protein S7|nr:30S ribosomal protein S7 [Candidatus Paceibacterota bacterium]